jgi:hypothetical protein
MKAPAIGKLTLMTSVRHRRVGVRARNGRFVATIHSRSSPTEGVAFQFQSIGSPSGTILYRSSSSPFPRGFRRAGPQPPQALILWYREGESDARVLSHVGWYPGSGAPGFRLSPQLGANPSEVISHPPPQVCFSSDSLTSPDRISSPVPTAPHFATCHVDLRFRPPASPVCSPVS